MRTLRDIGVRVRIEAVDANDPHPNTYRLILRDGHERRFLRAISTGGGMIEVLHVNASDVSMSGDCYETLLWVRGDGHTLAQQPATLVSADAVRVDEAGGEVTVEVKASEFVSERTLAGLKEAFDIRAVEWLSPVLAVLARKDTCVPFNTCAETLRHVAGRNTPLWKLAVEYERARARHCPARWSRWRRR
jgi:L-serine dehydratase